MNYFWHLKKKFPNLAGLDVTAGVQRTQSSNVRLSGAVDEAKDQYYYDDFEDIVYGLSMDSIKLHIKPIMKEIPSYFIKGSKI